MSESFAEALRGGHPNSLGRTEEVVGIVLADHARLEELFATMADQDEVVRVRVGDALEKVCRERPGWFVTHVDRLLGDLGHIEQVSVQWHIAQILHPSSSRAFRRPDTAGHRPAPAEPFQIDRLDRPQREGGRSRRRRTTHATLPGLRPDATSAVWHHGRRCSLAVVLFGHRSTSPRLPTSATCSAAHEDTTCGLRSRTRSWCSDRLDLARACMSSSTRSSTLPVLSSRLRPGPTTSRPRSPPAEPGDRSQCSTPSGSPRACRLGSDGPLRHDLPTGGCEHTLQSRDLDVGNDPIQGLPVQVYDPQQLTEPGDGWVGHRLPDRALIKLAVTDETDEAPGRRRVGEVGAGVAMSHSSPQGSGGADTH